MSEGVNYKGKIDFAIITVREDEYSAVLKRFPPKERFRGKNRMYGISRIELPESDYYLVACAASIEQGSGQAQDLARDIIEDLDPSMIFLVGIAGAVPDHEFTLGDVVIAKRLHDYCVSAAVEGEGRQYLNQGGPLPKLVQDLLAQLPLLKMVLGDWNTPKKIGAKRPSVSRRPATYGSDQWKKKVLEALRAHFGPKAPSRKPIVTARSMASGNLLVKESEVVQDWLAGSRELSAVEMELSGVYIAARRIDREYPVLAIRGISDVVGLQRDPAWTQYACETAASCARAFIMAPMLPSKFKGSAGQPDTGTLEKYCNELRERRVGKADEWGGELHEGCLKFGKNIPRRFLGFGLLVVQVVPESASLQPPRHCDLSKVQSSPQLVEKLQSWTKACESFQGYHHDSCPASRQRRNSDGLLIFSTDGKDGEYSSYYIQFYENGVVEAVDHRIMSRVLHSNVIPGTAVEQAVLSLTRAVLEGYRLLGVKGRAWLAVSIIDHLEYSSVSYDEGVSAGPAKVGKKHRLLLPPVIFDLEESIGSIVVRLNGVFDSLAHAGGWDNSPNRY